MNTSGSQINSVGFLFFKQGLLTLGMNCKADKYLCSSHLKWNVDVGLGGESRSPLHPLRDGHGHTQILQFSYPQLDRIPRAERVWSEGVNWTNLTVCNYGTEAPVPMAACTMISDMDNSRTNTLDPTRVMRWIHHHTSIGVRRVTIYIDVLQKTQSLPLTRVLRNHPEIDVVLWT